MPKPGSPVSLGEAIKFRTAALSGFNPKELAMRVLACLAIAVIAVPARAQTYDPSYPVCLQVYTIDGDHFECRYSTLAQCQASASGRGGTQCLTNPYFARAGSKPPGQVDRRPQRVY
jgi:hypothetical protein